MRDDEVRELVGDDDRLRRAHEALVAAGPPAEVPPGLLVPPGLRPRRGAGLLPRRRPAAALVRAAAIVRAACGAGYRVAARGEPAAFRQDFSLVMAGTAAAPGAAASLVVGQRDDAGNWPMEMTVTGLPALPELGRYELLLTRGGRPAASCGTFTVDGRTVVYLNAPYALRTFDGWVVTRAGSEEILLRTPEI